MSCSTLSVRRPVSAIMRKGLPLAMLVACVSLLAAASPAAAAPGRSGCSIHARGACLPSCSYPYRGRYTQRQYDRGYYAGADDGFDAGYYDGRYGRRYCDAPDYRIRRHSRHYRNGYLDGFADGYDEGYRKGQKRRHRWHRRGRCDCC